MKNTLIATFFCLISSWSFSQITLEHTFTSTIGSTQSVNTNDQTMYYLHDATNHVLTLYNNDYSLYKTITITPPSGYQFSPSFNLTGSITTKEFNTDNLVEFGYIFQTSGTPVTYKLILYNENLQVVKDFGNRLSIYTFQTVNDGLKCTVLGFFQDPNPPYTMTYYNDIYSLPGTLPVGVLDQLPLETNLSAFPNPSNSSVIIPYSLKENENTVIRIYNENGQNIDTFPITGREKQFNYNVKSLSPGLYIYQYKDKTGKFLVQ